MVNNLQNKTKVPCGYGAVYSVSTNDFRYLYIVIYLYICVFV